MNTVKFLTVAAVAATLLSQTAVVRGDDDQNSNRDHRNAAVSWTKWVTDWPANDGLTGVFGFIGGPAQGDIGEGSVTGEALNPREVLPDGSHLRFEADYHFRGSRHSLTVHFIVTQNLVDNSGVVEGVVTDGWLKGNHVTGQYTARACGEGEGDLSPCFEGTAEIERGSKNTD